MFPRYTGCINNTEAVVGELFRKLFQSTAAVEQDNCSGGNTVQYLGAKQGCVQYQQMMGTVNLVAIFNDYFVDSGKGAYRSTGAFGSIITKGLHMESHLRIDCGNQFGASHSSLAATTMESNF